LSVALVELISPRFIFSNHHAEEEFPTAALAEAAPCLGRWLLAVLNLGYVGQRP
jgi:hypothetical protein